VSPGVCQLQELEKGDKCSTDESITSKYDDDPQLEDDMKKKEIIEIKEQTEEDESDKSKKEEVGGEESVRRRHWSQFNYRSTVSLLINFRF
jgi:hypothetical protein